MIFELLKFLQKVKARIDNNVNQCFYLMHINADNYLEIFFSFVFRFPNA